MSETGTVSVGASQPRFRCQRKTPFARPNDPESYYRSREIVPSDMLGDIDHAKIVLTNYHAFKFWPSPSSHTDG